MSTSTPQPPDLDNEDSQARDIEETDAEEIPHADVDGEAEINVRKKRERREPVPLVQEPGKSLLPFSRVQKIIKADKEIPIIAKEATFLISLATEQFIKRLCEAAQRIADREKRATVQHKDIATVVRKADEFVFLEEIIPWTTADPPAKRKPKVITEGGMKATPTLLDQFVGAGNKRDKDVVDQPDVVMNEDGTMYAAEIQGDFEV